MKAVAENIKIPALRFPEFYTNWEEFQLRDQCVLITKGTTPKHFESSGSVTFVKLEAISDNIVQREKCLSISDEVHEEELKRSRLEEGDLLLAIAGATVGKLGLVHERILPANTNQALAIIRTKGNLQRFLIHQMQSPLMSKYISRCVAVGAQPNLSLKQVGEYPVCLPADLLEQQRIAEFLTAVDEKIAKLKRKKELLEEYKKGMMQKLFSQEIRFKDEDGNDFPDWEVDMLGNRFTIGSGRDYKHLEMGSVPVYGSAGEVMLHVSDALFTGESVGIGRKGTIDRPIRLSGSFWTVDTLFYTHSFLKADVDFVYQLFLVTPWLKYNEASGVPSLSKKTIAGITASFPSESEQKLIADCLAEMDKKIASIDSQVEKAQEFKRGLLQKMFV